MEDERVTEGPEVWDRLPFALKGTPRAAMYLQDWQAKNCHRLCPTGQADQCHGRCELPSVRRIQRNAQVSYGSAARARRRLGQSDQSRCLEGGGDMEESL